MQFGVVEGGSDEGETDEEVRFYQSPYVSPAQDLLNTRGAQEYREEHEAEGFESSEDDVEQGIELVASEPRRRPPPPPDFTLGRKPRQSLLLQQLLLTSAPFR